MTSLMGRLVDKANVIKASFSEIEKAVIKATKHNLKAPKEKHVRRLIVATHEQSSKNGELIGFIAKRLEVPDWIVVMKTLEVVHRLMRDGNPSFINDLKYKATLFNLRQFTDISTPEAHYQSIFIRKYGQYIEEKVLVFKLLNVELEKDPAAVKNFSLEEAFEKVPRLQSQLNALLNCRASKNHINNPIIVYGFTLLLKDSFKLYSALNGATINLLEHYFTMNRTNAVRTLEIYKLFTKETEGIIQFFDITRKFSRSDLPELQHAPTTLVEALEGYIKDLDAGRQTGNGLAQGQQIAKQMNSNLLFKDADFFDDQGSSAGNGEESSDEESHSNRKKSSAPTPDFSNSQPPIGGRTTQNAPPPANFDPFGLEAEFNNMDALPTYGGNSNSHTNIPQQQQQQQQQQRQQGGDLFSFDDPFSMPTNVQSPQLGFVDKKKQVEMIMAQGSLPPTSSTPLQPTPAFNPTPNYNLGGGQMTPFGQQNMVQPFGGNQLTPYGQQQQQQQQFNNSNPFFTAQPQQNHQQNDFNPFA